MDWMFLCFIFHVLSCVCSGGGPYTLLTTGLYICVVDRNFSTSDNAVSGIKRELKKNLKSTIILSMRKNHTKYSKLNTGLCKYVIKLSAFEHSINLKWMRRISRVCVKIVVLNLTELSCTCFQRSFHKFKILFMWTRRFN